LRRANQQHWNYQRTKQGISGAPLTSLPSEILHHSRGDDEHRGSEVRRKRDERSPVNRTIGRVQPWLSTKSDTFEDQAIILASRGCRRIDPDRDGHGRSSQPWRGNAWTLVPTT